MLSTIIFTLTMLSYSQANKLSTIPRVIHRVHHNGDNVHYNDAPIPLNAPCW